MKKRKSRRFTPNVVFVNNRPEINSYSVVRMRLVHDVAQIRCVHKCVGSLLSAKNIIASAATITQALGSENQNNFEAPVNTHKH